MLKKFISHLDKFLITCCVLLFLISWIFAVLQVFLRDILGSTPYWIAPLMVNLMIAAALLAVGPASLRRKHLAFDIFSARSSGLTKQVLTVIQNIISIVIVLLFSWGAFKYFSQLFILNTIDVGTGLPQWIFFVIPSVGLMIGLAFLFHDVYYSRTKANSLKGE